MTPPQTTEMVPLREARVLGAEIAAQINQSYGAYRFTEEATAYARFIALGDLSDTGVRQPTRVPPPKTRIQALQMAARFLQGRGSRPEQALEVALRLADFLEHGIVHNDTDEREAA